MKQCPNCNASLEDHAVFCVYCGIQLPEEPVAEQPANAAPTQQAPVSPTCESPASADQPVQQPVEASAPQTQPVQQPEVAAQPILQQPAAPQPNLNQTAQPVQPQTPPQQPFAVGQTQVPPPPGTPVYGQPPYQQPVQQFYQPPAQPLYQQPGMNPFMRPVYPINSGLLAWSIVLIVLGTFICGLPTLIMSIISLTSVTGAKNALNDFEYQQKLKNARVLNIISTVLLVLGFGFVILAGILGDTSYFEYSIY